jgi:hypothetical protein
MTDPSSEKKGGVFDNIKGAHSRDPDEVEPTPETETTETKPQEPVEVSEPDKAETDRVLRLKQELAQKEAKMAQMGPYAQLGQAVANDKGQGQAVIQRWQRGEKLFIDESESGYTMEEAKQPPSGPPALTEESLGRILDQRDGARRQADDLDSVARESLEHFDKISKNPRYVQFLDNNLKGVWEGYIPLEAETLEWSDQNRAKNFSAMKQAYRQVLADNPKVIAAAKEAGKKETAERTEAAMAASGSGGTSTSAIEEPAERTDAEEMIDRMVNAHGTGKSFTSVARKK